MSLVDLPSEILCLVLYHVLPDLMQVAYSTDPRAADALFVQPVLQVCRLLRIEGHAVIEARDTWITFEIHPDKHPEPDFGLANPPILSPKFHHYIEHAATMKFELNLRSARSSRPLEDVEYTKPVLRQTFPFNLQILLRRWTMFQADCEYKNSGDLLSIFPQNMHRRMRTDVRDLALAAVTLMGCSYHLTVKYADNVLNTSMLDQQPRSRYKTREKLNLWLEHTTSILESAVALTEKGYDEEAGLLLLSSKFLLTDIGNSLNYLRYYKSRVAETSPTEFTILESTRRPLHIVNQVRKLAWYIQQGATITAALLLARYGPGWGSEHGVVDNAGAGSETRLIDWLGATKSEWAYLYLRNAALMYVTWQRRKISSSDNHEDQQTSSPTNSNITTTESQPAEGVRQLKEVLTASYLDPQNQCIQKLRDKLSTTFGEQTTAEAETQAKTDLKKESCNAYQADGKRVEIIWEGDAKVIGTQGVYSLRYHLLMQEGIPAYPGVAALLDKLTRALVQEVTK